MIDNSNANRRVLLEARDIVKVMTNGEFSTSVIANEMYTQFKTFELGRPAAFAVVLFIMVTPIIVYNARQLKKQKEIR